MISDAPDPRLAEIVSRITKLQKQYALGFAAGVEQERARIEAIVQQLVLRDIAREEVLAAIRATREGQ